MTNTSRGTLVFDGDCGFCTWVADKAKRWIRPRANIVAYQFADLGSLGLTAVQCSQALQWVDADGSHRAAGRAVSGALLASPQPWPILGAALDLPGMSFVVEHVYALIARNRYRLPGATPACQLSAAPQAA